MYTIEVSARAETDLRRIQRGPQRRLLRDGIQMLAEPSANLDVKAVIGHPPWRRLRVGDFRVLYRPVDATTLLVGRVVDRGDLERAIAAL